MLCGFNPRPHRGAGATVRMPAVFLADCVSILARTEVRALPRNRGPLDNFFDVSILARTEVRALPGLGPHQQLERRVSILARTEVRALLAWATTASCRTCCFNPRPHRGAGATFADNNFVYVVNGFNPRPHRGAGATRRCAFAECLLVAVSILARTEVRALHSIAALLRIEKLFQSSPAPRCGRYIIKLARFAIFNGFQSSPAPRCGRYMR